MTHRCICFTRVSTTQQDIDQQSDVVLSRCRQDGYSPDDIIVISEQESAIKLSLSERVGIQKLFAAIEQDPLIDAVYIFEISRLSRQQTMLFEVRDFLLSHKVDLVCMKPEFRLLENGEQSLLGSMAFSMYAVISEQEMQIKQARMKRGRDAARARGQLPAGKPPYGWTTDEQKKFIVKASEAQTVTEIYERYATGRYSYHSLAEDLHSRGYFPSYRAPYCYKKVAEILTDERYRGAVAHYPRIVSDELFEACKKVRLSQRTHSKPATSKTYLCRGLAHAKGTKIVLSPSGNGRYFSPVAHVTVSQAALDGLVWHVAKQLYEANVSNMQLETARFTSSIKAATQRYNTALSERSRILSKIDALEERIIEGKISTKKQAELTARYEAELKKCDQSIADAVGEATYWKLQMRKLKSSELHPDMDSLPLPDKIDIVRLVIEDVVIERLDAKTVRAEILTNFGSTLIYKLFNYTHKFELEAGLRVE